MLLILNTLATPDTPDVPDVPTNHKGYNWCAATQDGLTVGSVSAEKDTSHIQSKATKSQLVELMNLIAYVKADEATGVTAGNYIGVKITAPADFRCFLNPIVVFL